MGASEPAPPAPPAPRRGLCARLASLEVDRFLCCSLRAGVLFAALLLVHRPCQPLTNRPTARPPARLPARGATHAAH